MVLLTMTPPIVEAVRKRYEIAPLEESPVERDPALESPAVDKPISHGQVLELWKQLKSHDGTKYSLENLLRGARVYIPPPPPKPEPTDEYKALMARLRREEEERKYQRMVSSSAFPATAMPSFAQRFPSTSLAQSFAEVNRPSNKVDEGDDDVTYNDVHRQFVLVINFLVTIFGCAATLWILARWWSTPARLFLTMGGSLVVAIAEVGVYYAYVWHLGDAKKKDAKVREVKEVVETWVVGKEDKVHGVESQDTDRREVAFTPSSHTGKKRSCSLTHDDSDSGIFSSPSQVSPGQFRLN